MNDELEDQLRVGGAKVSEGVFRVDAKRALAKLREYRLAEPHHWVLEVLRAASSCAASDRWDSGSAASASRASRASPRARCALATTRVASHTSTAVTVATIVASL